MSLAPTEETIKLWYLLQDGQWHDLRVIRHDLSLTIPTGRAVRHNEGERQRLSRHGGPRRRPITSEAAARYGRRGLATTAINSARRGGRAEIDPEPTKALWQSDTEMRIRWVGDSLAGFYAPLAEQAEIAETAARDAVFELRLLHTAGRQPGVCAADGQPQPCTTIQLLDKLLPPETPEEKRSRDR